MVSNPAKRVRRTTVRLESELINYASPPPRDGVKSMDDDDD